MLLSDIIKRINKLVSNSSSFQLNYAQLQHYIDAAVDHINLVLKTDMLTPQEQYERENIHNYINSLLSQYGVFTISDLMVALSRNGENITSYSEFRDYIDNQISIDTVPMSYNYTEMPDNIIRTVLIYHIAASYLEEEDEFESQHQAYMNRADSALQDILKTYYSMYRTDMDSDLYRVHRHHPHKEGEVKPFNPYWIAGDD